MRSLIELVTWVSAWSRRLFRLRVRSSDSKPLKLNLGCGLAVHRGWINIDGSLNAMIAGWPRIVHSIAYRLSGANRYYGFPEYDRLLSECLFFHADLTHGIPAPDGSADFIYSSHFLEHLYYKDAEKLLSECHRVLKPGGVLRICVPDLEHACRLIAEGRKHEALTSYFFVEDKASSFARHRYMYDFELLSHVLEKLGFTAISRQSYQRGVTPDIRFLDNRPEETLFVEAVR